MGDLLTDCGRLLLKEKHWKGVALRATTEPAPQAAETQRPADERRPQFFIDAVTLLGKETENGKITLSNLGSCLRQSNPSFSTKTFGYSGLRKMISEYSHLECTEEGGTHWVRLKPKKKTGSIGMDRQPRH